MSKRVVLTGATGFLGSHLASAMHAAGHEVIALKRRSSSLHRVASIASELTMLDVDGIDFDQIFTRFGKVDTIIHTATCYGRNNESASAIFSANTEFPLHLLDAGSRAGVRAFINTDTILDKYLNLYAFSKYQLLERGKFFSHQKKITFWNIKLKLTGSTTHLDFGALPYREGEVMQSVANVQRLLALGWRCIYDIERGIRQVVEMEKTSS